MSRPIKYRAWDKIRNKMQSVTLFEFMPNDEIDAECDAYRMVHGEYELLQFTGLKDSKGVEIYEGDIIHYGYYEDLAENDDLTRPMNFSVKWSTADGGWTANGRLIDWDKNGIYDREVIGNIHSGNLTWK